LSPKQNFMGVELGNTSRKTILQITGIWLFLRCLTSLAAAAFSIFNPLTPIEKQIALWPPARDLPAWLYRVLVAPWARYDSDWFHSILTNGYTAGDGTTSFHPLYPWLSYPLYRLGMDANLSLLITSALAALVLMGIFYCLARLDHEPSTAWIALVLLATFPIAFILFAPYAESLFLLWAVLAFYSMRKHHWVLAALFSFLAALTRQQGLFLALPLGWAVWEASGKTLKGARRIWYAWLTPLAAPAGLVIWATYRIGWLHEGNLNFSNIQGFIYSAFLSPSADKVVVGQAFRWPWDAIIVAVSKAIHAPELNVFINLSLGIGFLIAFIIAWKHINIEGRLYSLAIIAVSFCVTTGQIAYISLPRHLFLAFPVFIGLAESLQKSRQRRILFAIQILVMLFLVFCFVNNYWIP
jgi:hypothetical protein